MTAARRQHTRKQDYRSPNPGAARVSAGRPDPSAASRAVYDGTHRQGSYRRDSTGAWRAYDRLGREIGVFGTEGEAANAISAAAGAAGEDACGQP